MSRTHDVPPGQTEVLAAVRALTAAGERVSAYAVAERLGVTRQNAQQQLLALEKKGLVRDEPRVVRSGNWKLT